VSLEPLIGEWTTEVRFPNGVSGTGRSTFEPVLGGAYLLQRATADVEGPPEGLMVIGPDEQGALTQHYFDSRGVARRYALSLEGDTLTIQRDEPTRSRSSATSSATSGASRTTTRSAAPGSGGATAPGSTTSSWSTNVNTSIEERGSQRPGFKVAELCTVEVHNFATYLLSNRARPN
jgi:hypothetical protein